MLSLRVSVTSRTRRMAATASSTTLAPSWALSRALWALDAASPAFLATSRTTADISRVAAMVSSMRCFWVSAPRLTAVNWLPRSPEAAFISTETSRALTATLFMRSRSRFREAAPSCTARRVSSARRAWVAASSSLARARSRVCRRLPTMVWVEDLSSPSSATNTPDTAASRSPSATREEKSTSRPRGAMSMWRR